ncbi:MAG TPA: CocE/NonD family hydrolase [Actinomadura sp.]|nr:CocE/NonD family hydrolase [Actinomadura sp.]
MRRPVSVQRKSTPTRLRALGAVGVLVLAGFLVPGSGPAAAKAAPSECSYTSRKDVPARMRDGTVLRANVFTPAGPGDHPVILMRLPYNKDTAQTYVYAQPDFYAAHCYVVVIQDVRGQYKSDGSFYTFRNEAADGYDTIEWAARLPHANGRVGMYGFSYPGATQWLPATLRPPHLVTIVPAMTSSDYHDGWTYEGGALDLSFAEDWPLTTIANSAVRRYPDGAALDASMNKAAKEEFSKWYWHLPLKNYPPLRPDDPRVAPYFFDWLKHPDNDAYWQQWSIRRRYGQVTVPTLNFDGWYDIFVNGALENFEGMRRQGGSQAGREGTKLVVGPWVHMPWSRKVGQIDFGPQAVNPIDALQLRWFDYWLKGVRNGIDTDPAVRVFVMGADKWRSADAWPIPGTAYRSYYLHSQGDANTLTGTGTLSTSPPASGETATDRYKYDPSNPVPSFGGRFQASVPGGPYDQRLIEQRPDVLVYSTPALAQDVEVTGPITMTLYAASSAPDTDWTAKLTDVHPDGTSMLIQYGIQRARYRVSETHPTPIKPGKIYKYTIQVWPTSNLFKAGHQIRLEISSSNFPMYDRNPNTGHPFGQDADLRVARQTIYHDVEHPSAITLPVMPHPLH